MANISITIPDAALSRVVDSICIKHSYQAILMDGSVNTETKGQFAKRMIAQTVKNWMRETEGNTASDISRKAVTDDVNAIVIT